MKKIAIVVLALSLTACASTDTSSFLDLVKTAAQDPRCGHTDRIQGNLGGIGGNNLAVYFERSCPAPPQVVQPVTGEPQPVPH
jgi:hypothetical protein